LRHWRLFGISQKVGIYGASRGAEHALLVASLWAALSAVAAAALADTHLFDATSGLDDAVRRLRSIRGVGEWTAQYIALRQLREPDAFPAADIGLMRAITSRERRKYSLSELLDRANTWRPWRAYAAQHLWASA